jgi:hypothetical protein
MKEREREREREREILRHLHKYFVGKTDNYHSAHRYSLIYVTVAFSVPPPAKCTG